LSEAVEAAINICLTVEQVVRRSFAVVFSRMPLLHYLVGLRTRTESSLYHCREFNSNLSQNFKFV